MAASVSEGVNTVVITPLLMTGTVNFPKGSGCFLLFVACCLLLFHNHPPAFGFFVTESSNLTMSTNFSVGEAQTTEEVHCPMFRIVGYSTRIQHSVTALDYSTRLQPLDTAPSINSDRSAAADAGFLFT